jgi:hypothetical protein
MKVEFNQSLTTISGETGKYQFEMSLQVVGGDDPELRFYDESFYNKHGNSINLNGQQRNKILESIATYIYGTEKWGDILREYEIANYDYTDFINEY